MDVARTGGARGYLLDRAEEIDPAWLTRIETVGVTAGASAPEHLVQEVIGLLKERHGGERVFRLGEMTDALFQSITGKQPVTAK